MMHEWFRLLTLWPLIWVTLAFSQAAIAQNDPLEPDAAFKFSARALDAQTLEARWQIADGYYMYRDKFKFELAGGTLGRISLPPGKLIDDPTFGRVETYRKDIRITLPIQRAPGATAVTLTATSQGCWEGGLCYLPQTQKVSIPLPAVSTQAASTPAAAATPANALPTPPAAGGALASLRELVGMDDTPTVLPPEEAFIVAATMTDAQTVRVDYTLTPDTYLYRDKLTWAVKAPAGVSVAKAETPAGKMKDDPTFGMTEVYLQNIAATVSLSRPLAAGETLILEAGWQGCNDAVGICYPPVSRAFTLTPSGVAAAAASPGPAAAGDESDTSRIERVLQGGSFWAVIATFFGLGLLLALTPCVFPMIPILSGIIAGQSHITPLTKTRGFLLSLAYVLGMAITYAALGVAAALSGTLLSAALQNPWALGFGAAMFVLLALSMFGFFEIQLPSFVQSKFSDVSNRMKGGTFIGVFIMGALSAAIISPCVAPPLAAALAFIAQTGNTVLGGTALFVLALGMGVPLLLVGLSAGTLLPRAGGWMNAVKYFFGVLMLAVAIYLISSIIPGWLHMLLWAALLIASAVYLRALDPLPEKASGWARLWKGLGVLLLIGGLALLVGMLAGGRDPLQPLDVFKGGAVAAERKVMAFERVRDVAELDARLASAQAAGKTVMLDFYADWCASCKEMERFTFSDARVQARLADTVLLKADVTANSEADRALLKRFGLFGPPGIIFWTADGTQSGFKVIGFERADKFLASIDAALGS